MNEDFEMLRQHVWDSGLMKVNPWFYITHFCKSFIFNNDKSMHQFKQCDKFSGHYPLKYASHVYPYSSFSQIHKVGNVGIIANFIFPYISSFLLHLDQLMLVNVKL